MHSITASCTNYESSIQYNNNNVNLELSLRVTEKYVITLESFHWNIFACFNILLILFALARCNLQPYVFQSCKETPRKRKQSSPDSSLTLSHFSLPFYVRKRITFDWPGSLLLLSSLDVKRDNRLREFQ